MVTSSKSSRRGLSYAYPRKVKSLKQTYTIKSPISKVWQALTDPKIIDAWGGGPAKMQAKIGFKFSLWGGDITGTNTKVVPEKLLVQDWMSGKWDEFSKLEFRLSEKSGITTVILTQSNIPDSELADISEGWKVYYLGKIKKLLENS